MNSWRSGRRRRAHQPALRRPRGDGARRGHLLDCRHHRYRRSALLRVSPAGYSSWCLKELAPIPAGYVLDTSLHCSAVLNTTSPPSAMTLALPEVPVPGGPPQLAFTGGPGLGPLWVGLGMVLAGALLRRSAGARAKGDRSGGG